MTSPFFSRNVSAWNLELSPAPTPDRGPHLHRLSGLLFVHHAAAPPACLGAGVDRSAIEKFAAVQMIDVHAPTTDGRELVLTRYTQPEPELQLLINQLKFQLPPQPLPRITAASQTSQPLP
jgi:hypothetical protein